MNRSGVSVPEQSRLENGVSFTAPAQRWNRAQHEGDLAWVRDISLHFLIELLIIYQAKFVLDKFPCHETENDAHINGNIESIKNPKVSCGL